MAFKPDEDFNEIITRSLDGEVGEITPISTGWTNIVIEAKSKCGQAYFFRFPRNSFWSKVLLKDVRFANFIRGKTSFETPDLKLMHDEGRPFSRHKKINGWTFAERLGHLSRGAISVAAVGMARFVRELGMVDISELTAKESKFVVGTCEEFLTDLADNHFADKTYCERFKIYRPDGGDQARLCHGDMGIRNVLVDDGGNITGIIDFAFASLGDNKHMDLSRLLSQSPPELAPVLLEAFEKEIGTLDKDRVAKSTDTWRYIDNQYIDFMRKHQPEISLPV